MRKSKTLTVPHNNRDFGATFHIEEMPAIQAEEWFIRAIRLLASAGIDMPPDIFRHGAHGFAALGIGTALSGLARAPWGETKDLMDDLLKCIQWYKAPTKDAIPIIDLSLIKTQVEEVSTFLWLREEIVSVHLGFSIRERFSEYRIMVAQKLEETGQNIPTSETSLDQSSPENSRH